jgi:hypothetical protein
MVSFSGSSGWYRNVAMSKLCAHGRLFGTFPAQFFSKRKDTIDGEEQTLQSNGVLVTMIQRMKCPSFSQRSVPERHGQSKTSPAAHTCVLLCEKVVATLSNLSTISLSISQGLA